MGKYYIGIDLGGTRIKMGLLQGQEIIDRTMIDASSANGLTGALAGIRDAVNYMLNRNHITPKHLSGLGLGFPGIVDPVRKKILSTNAKYDDAVDIDLEAWYLENWDGLFFIDNDTRLAALGEWKFGEGKNSDNLVVMTIGTGIGTAAIIDGKLMRGKHFQAALGGHFTIDYHGRACNCGNTGCLEAHASTWSISQRIMKDAEFEKSSLSTRRLIDFETLFQEADNEDRLALRVREDCFDAWAAGIVNLVHAYDPELIIIGGGVMNNREQMLKGLTNRVHQHAWTPWGKVQIKSSQLMEVAGIIGAVYGLQYSV